MTPPTLRTARLVLSPPTPDDLVDSAAMWADPDVTRYTGGAPATREVSWGRLLRYAGTWSLRGFGFWIVRERSTARYVGEVGFLDGHRDIEPSYEDVPEAGWALATWCHGQGYATEATRAALAWADAHLDVPRTVCMIERENAPSFRVAARCGFTPWVDAAYHGADVVLLQRPRGAR